MRSLVESTLGLSTAGWYDRVWFWSCSTGFGSDVRFFIARNTDVAGDPVNGEGFVAVFHVRLNIFVQCEIVTMWIADVFNGTLAVRVDDDVSCWLGLGVAECFADGRQFCLNCGTAIRGSEGFRGVGCYESITTCAIFIYRTVSEINKWDGVGGFGICDTFVGGFFH